MNAKKQLSLMVIGLSAMTTLSVVGATTGTLAWYAYNTRVTIAYQGTSVSRTEQLQVGLVDEYSSTFGWHLSDGYISEHKLTKQVVSATKNIVWAPAGGGLAAAVIAEFVKNSSNLNNDLSPLSSRGYNENGTFKLYSKLKDSNDITAHDNSADALNALFVFVPFAFKVSSNSGTSLTGKNIWITDVETKAVTAGKNTDKGVRTYFENVNASSAFLLNPSSTSLTAGSTRIAGVLDLNGDGYYDYDPDNNKEIVYGQYADAELTNGHITWAAPAESEVVVDANNVGSTTPSTFVAKHKEGVLAADYTNLQYTTAFYDTLNTVKPTVNELTGLYDEDSGKPVATTDSNGIGYTNLTIYLEGWDFAVTNSIIETKFNLGIQFQINKI